MTMENVLVNVADISYWWLVHGFDDYTAGLQTIPLQQQLPINTAALRPELLLRIHTVLGSNLSTKLHHPQFLAPFLRDSTSTEAMAANTFFQNLLSLSGYELRILHSHSHVSIPTTRTFPPQLGI
jgi:hypothetical protein